ncbi:MAG: glycosyltransferase family 9 protein [Steroidobacteraceae bacterium]
MLPLPAPPETACILRLSAIGDTCHVVPLLRTLQQAWPRTRFTWIVGRVESRLVGLLPEVEFITLDKRAGFAGLRELRRRLAGRRFDLLLHLQLALRASAVAALVDARVKLGFDRPRARELQWLFTNARIAARRDEHVLGQLPRLRRCARRARARAALGPAAAAGCARLRARRRARDARGGSARARTLVISACSSHAARNWRAERYAALAAHAVRRHGMRVVLAGGPAPVERAMADAIRAACEVPLADQVGKDTLPQLLALLARASVLLTPDSGPAHMATMVGTPVIGLYAATNPQRSGPYLSRQWCVDAYGRAARRYRGREPQQLPWSAKIEEPGVMDLITVEEVCERLDALLASRP